MPARPFENVAGEFGQFKETLPYLHTRLHYVKALMQNTNLQHQSRLAVETALHHNLDMLQLDRRDNMAVRKVIPAMYIRLGRDQECYDFIKFWHSAIQNIRFKYEPDAPYLNLTGASVFEPILFKEVGQAPIILQLIFSDFTKSDLGHMASLALVKIRLLLDLRSIQKYLQHITATDAGYPPEAFEHLRGGLFTDVVANDASDRRQRP